VPIDKRSFFSLQKSQFGQKALRRVGRRTNLTAKND
jgi:hypothetical protein